MRARVDAWRAQDHRGASATSRRLLGFWFADEHRFDDGRPFRFYFCQREAVETFIYLTEIEPVRGLKDLLEFAEHGMTIQPGEPKRQRLAIKMATGSGKTMAMSLCIVWSYFHAFNEHGSPMATSFLVIVPRPRFRPDTRLDRGGLHVESHGGSDGGRWGGSLRRTE